MKYSKEVNNEFSFSVIVPIYNEEGNIKELHHRLTKVMQVLAESYEIVFVNDGSTDSTAKTLLDLVHSDTCLKIINLSRNFGHQNALTAGIDFSKGRAVVAMDGDLQDPPEVIKSFVKKWQEGYKIVYGIRARRKESFILRLCYKLFYRLMKKISNIDIPLDSGDFCLMDRGVVEVLKNLPERLRFIRGLRAWAGFRQIGIEYERDARKAGKSKYSFNKLFKLAVEGFCSFSTFPIHVIFLLGVLLSVLAVLGIISVVTMKIFNIYHLPGWTSLFIAMLFFGSIQLIAISIVGEYCGKIFEEIKKRPIYMIESMVNMDGVYENDNEIRLMV